MPNYCDNYIRIKVPKQHKDALLEDLEGPGEMWWGGKRFLPFQNQQAHPSAHDLMVAEASRKDAQKAYSALSECPSWYQVNYHDILYWQTDPDLKHLKDRVPLSAAKKLAWKSAEDMERWNADIIQHAYSAWGCKWMPDFNGRHWEENLTSDNGYVYLDIRCMTPSGPPSDPISLFLSSLRKSNAQMSWAFQAEGDLKVGSWWTEQHEIHFADEEEYSCLGDPDDALDEEYSIVDFEAATEGLINIGMPPDLIENLF